ncbi:L-seryl-tRNA(Sec) selenium transferase [Berryella wangjianweii]|uniref:L-seryl-tRNA(Sec) selenium transferase n=1 Tax=Berryella wangjianweii TaxID=2734634 RepID=A0A6M8J0Z9_9ACTN|nr:L-seryl-tRNA(Sec) selenium transferase [Berryella wangjianweii]QKF07257.1 L-seryl-tRNA(Sec) selenium transferase [Berryella wangjianweii]
MPTPDQLKQLRSLPQVEEMLRQPALAAMTAALPRTLVVDQTRAQIDELRGRVLAGDEVDLSCEAVATSVVSRLRRLCSPSLRRAVNASGVIVHTNLGRSVLPEPAVQAVLDVARGYSTLEYDVHELRRGSRHDHYEALVCAVTGAEAAIAVNNNAAAVMMVLSEFAQGREVVVSRGELVEIGGSFRVPDIMRASGADMVEVGTTNKTHGFDYERAITERTALLMKVHPSNYRLTGFVEDVSVQGLRAIADAAGTARASGPVLVYEDLGSGALVDITAADLHEATVSDVLSSGADLVSFSCDKLLGGPQAGIIVGRREAIARLKKNPLARVLRLDKLSIAALEATLRLYLREDNVRRQIPTVRMLDADEVEVTARAERLKQRLDAVLSPADGITAIEREVARAGGGALPMCDIPTTVVALDLKRGSALGCERYLSAENPVPIVARIRSERVLFDALTLLSDDELDEVAQGVRRYFAGLGSEEPR